MSATCACDDSGVIIGPSLTGSSESRVIWAMNTTGSTFHLVNGNGGAGPTNKIDSPMSTRLASCTVACTSFMSTPTKGATSAG
jgi:hypothetical protein